MIGELRGIIKEVEKIGVIRREVKITNRNKKEIKQNKKTIIKKIDKITRIY